MIQDSSYHPLQPSSLAGMSRETVPVATAESLYRNVPVASTAFAGDEEAAPMVCRECLLAGDPSTLIAPCACTGREKWVHKDCLDKSRATPSRPQSVYNCERCKQDFKLFPKAGETSSQRHRRARFHALVLRDFFVVFCIVQLLIVTIGAIIKGIDDASAYCMPQCQDGNSTSGDCTICPPIKTVLFPQTMEDHDRITYYICGIVGFLATIGFFGLCNSCCTMIDAPAPVVRHSTRHQGGCCELCCQGCCNECGRTGVWIYRDDGCCCCCDTRHHSSSSKDCKCDSNNGDKDAGAAIVVVVAIIVILFAVVGIFYGIVLATALFQRIVQRHIHRLELRLITADYPVADLSQPLDENIPYAQIVNDVREMV